MNLYTNLVALDIGTSCIKMINLAAGPGKQGYKVIDMHSAEIEVDLIGGDFTKPYIKDIQKFKTILSTLIAKISSSHQGFIVGLPDRWVKLHFNSLLLSDSEKKNPDFLRWRLEKTLPVPSDIDVMVDYMVLDSENEDAQGYQTVLAAAVNKSIIEILSAVTTQLQMEVMAFDTSSLGIYNLYQEAYPEQTYQQNVINLHIGNETTVVKVYDKGSLVYERVIEVAGESFSSIISQLDCVDLAQAHKIKQDEKFFPTNREDVLQLLDKRTRIDKVFGNWLRELNVTFRFYQEKFKTTRLPSIFITGGSGLFEGLAEFLALYFETRCELFNPFEEIPLTHKLTDNQLFYGPQFAACIGLLAK